MATVFGGLGVTLAVAAAVTTSSVTDGARRAMLRDVAALGTDTILVRANPGASQPLTVHDAAALRAMRRDITTLSFVREERVFVDGPLASRNVTALGVSADFAAVRSVATEEGRFLHAADAAAAARVCVLGSRLVRELFGPTPPLSRYVRIRDDWFAVVGVLSPAEEDVVFVPFAALAPRRPEADPGQPVTSIWVSAARGRVDEALRSLNLALDGQEIIPARRLLESRYHAQRLFHRLGWTLAGLLFLLGGGAIGNALLAGVIERTPEIGLRRAVGATRRAIAWQFLCEAALLSAGGAGAGAVAGVLLSWQIASRSGWPVELSATSVLSITVLTLLVGLTAGTYPALRAASVQPIEAILHE